MSISSRLEEQEQDHGRKENEIPDIHRRIQAGSLGVAQEQREDSAADRTRSGDHARVVGEVARSVSGDLERCRANSFGTQRYGSSQARDQTTAATFSGSGRRAR